MISNKLLKTQEQSLDLDSIAGLARCTPLKDKPTECGTRCSKILTSRVKIIWTKLPRSRLNYLLEMWTQFFWVPSTREYLSIIRVLGGYSVPFVVHLFLNNQLRSPPTRTGSWERSSSRKQLTKTIRSEGALRERTFYWFFFSVTSVLWHPWWIFLILDQQ